MNLEQLLVDESSKTVTPKLSAALRQYRESTDPEIRHRCAMTMAPGLVELLEDPNPTIKQWALAGLKGIDEPLMPLLTEALHDSNPVGLRQAMLILLAQASSFLRLPRVEKALENGRARPAGEEQDNSGPESWNCVPPFRAVPELSEALAAPQTRVRAIAAWQLGCHGIRALETTPLLRRALKDPLASIREAALTALARIAPRSEATLADLVACLGDEESEVWTAAVDLASLLGSAAVPTMITALGDDSPLVCLRAAKALGQAGTAAAVAIPTLIDIVKSNDLLRRLAAIEALGALGAEALSAVPALVDASADPAPEVRQLAVEALKRIDPEAAPAKAPLAAAVKSRLQRFWASVLGGGAGLLILLLVLWQLQLSGGIVDDVSASIDPDRINWTLKNGNQQGKRKALEALSKLDAARVPAETPPLVVAILIDKENPIEMRRNAVVVLGKIGAQAVEGIGALARTVTDSTDPLQPEAALALARGSPEARHRLLQVMTEPGYRFYSPDLATALTPLSPEEWSVLLSLLQTGSMEIQVQVIRLLGLLGPGARPALRQLQALAQNPSAPQNVRELAALTIPTIKSPLAPKR